jgi:hypothetical protein
MGRVVATVEMLRDVVGDEMERAGEAVLVFMVGGGCCPFDTKG